MEEYRKNNLGLVRFLLAIVVFVAHFLELTQIKDLSFLTPWAKSVLAVQLFFMLSGYFSVSSFERSKTVLSFFIKRFLRIYPAYFFVVGMSFLFLSLFSSLTLVDYFTSLDSWKYLAANLIFANFLAPILPGVFETNYLPHINGSLWTLKIEVAYFLFVPIIFLCRKYFGIWIVNISLILLSFLYAFLIERFFSAPDVLIKQLPGQLHWFAFGIIVYDIRYKILQVNAWLYFALFVLIFFLHNVWPPMFYISVISLVYGVGFKLPFFKISDWLGNISYSVYLIHFPIIQVGITMGFNNSNSIQTLLIALTVIMLCSFFIYRFIERPYMVNGNKDSQKLKA
jgi:peptidoglycan/LPS O-acetylase OafA/YrhL